MDTAYGGRNSAMGEPQKHYKVIVALMDKYHCYRKTKYGGTVRTISGRRRKAA